MGNTKGVSYNGNLYYHYINYLKSLYLEIGSHSVSFSICFQLEYDIDRGRRRKLEY